jgi:UDP-N-acetylmuramate dehydrogenase
MDWALLEEWLEGNRVGEWRAHVPLAGYTSWKIGGPARLMVWPAEEEGFAALVRHCSRNGFPVRFIGAGTNLLVADEGVEALVVHTGALQHWTWEGERVTAGAGLLLARLAEAASQRGLSGLEFAAGIPGSFGGALFMNAGAYQKQMSDAVESVRALHKDGEIRVLEKKELAFGYRTGGFPSLGLVILAGTLRLAVADREKSLALMREYIDLRKQKQPLGLPSGGSVFRNPAGGAAGRYIDWAGLKGLRIGNAQISPKHANFIVNLGGAEAGDVRQLMEVAQKEVKAKFNVSLESEIICWD